MKRLRKDTLALLLEAERRGYVRALIKTGPVPKTEEQRLAFLEYFKAEAEKEIPA